MGAKIRKLREKRKKEMRREKSVINFAKISDIFYCTMPLQSSPVTFLRKLVLEVFVNNSMDFFAEFENPYLQYTYCTSRSKQQFRMHFFASLNAELNVLMHCSGIGIVVNNSRKFIRLHSVRSRSAKGK